MVRYSKKRKVLRILENLRNERSNSAFFRNVLLSDSSDGHSCESSDDDLECIRDMMVQSAIEEVEQSRYLFRTHKYRDRKKVFNWSDAIQENSKRFSADEFRTEFRMSRHAFNVIFPLIHQHKVFKKEGIGKKQYAVQLQMLVFLKRIGSEGAEGNSKKIANFFGISSGTVRNIIKRVTKAILSLKDDVIMWPKASEREAMKTQIKVLYGFQNCIGIIDGTIVILDKRPSYYGDSYWCRKQCYSMNMQVVCDHNGRITYLVGGWPGSVHDNRAWRNCSLFVNADTFFNFEVGEYLVGK